MNKELEFTEEQIERIDAVENAAFEFAKQLVEDENLEWDMSFIGEIADVATDIMVSHGYRVFYPAIVNGGENNEEDKLIDYIEPDTKG